MSVLFDVIGEGLSQGNNVAANSLYTAMCWVKINTIPAEGFSQVIFMRHSTDGTQFIKLEAIIDGFMLSVSDGVSTIYSSVIAFNEDQYYHIAVVKSTATMHKLYVNRVEMAYVSAVDTDLLTFNTLELGYYGGSDPYLEVAYFREWDAALTRDELLAEALSGTAVKADPITDTPLTANYADVSGNGNDWSPGGSPSFVTNPVFPTPPANWTAATATVVSSLPYETVQTDLYSLGFVFDAWFSFTPAVYHIAMGISFRGDSASLYSPYHAIYIDNDDQLLASQVSDRMSQIGLITGRPILLKVYDESSLPDDANLNISLLHCPMPEVAVDAIFIRGASIPSHFIDYNVLGLYGGFIDAATGEIIGYIPIFPVGESGDYLPNGMTCFGDDYDVGGEEGRITLYNANFTVHTHNTFLWYTQWPNIRASRETNKFYVASFGDVSHPSQFVSIGIDGAMSSPVTFPGPLVGVTAVANSHDDAFVYVAVGNPSEIKKYDKSGLSIGTFAAAVTSPANYRVWDILVMEAGEIVAVYQTSAPGVQDFFVRVYDPTGTILRTYTPAGSIWYTTTPARLGYALDDSISFWLFLHYHGPAAGGNPSGYSRMIQVNLSDVTELENLVAPDINYFQSNQGDTPDYRFVTSNSCPHTFAEAPADTTPPEPEPGNDSGIYYKKPSPPPAQRHDIYYTDVKKIPNPTIRTALFGE